MQAVEAEFTLLVEILLNYLPVKAIEVLDLNGQNALFYAVKNRNLELVNILLGFGISTAELDSNGESLLSIALQTGEQSIISALMRHQFSNKPDD
jgi:ankyrin repeat protein